MSLAFKLTTLLVRTLSKPVANTIKTQAQEHPRFRKICISFAQLMHRVDVNVRLRLLNERNLKVRPLNDSKAIQNGATFLADSFVFSVAGSIILFEYWRSAQKEAARRASITDDIKVLQDEINWLEARLREKKILTEQETAYTVPDGIEPSVLQLKHKDGKLTGEVPKEDKKGIKKLSAASTPVDKDSSSSIKLQ